MIDYNKKNGEDFEKFIAQKFNRKYFIIKDWRGDKYINGIYAETTLQPDILLAFELGDKKTEFAVECKWRRRDYKERIELASEEQIKRYKKFKNIKKMPVFIALGIGGTGENPKKLFIIPIENIKSNFISVNSLKSFEKKVLKTIFISTL